MPITLQTASHPARTPAARITLLPLNQSPHGNYTRGAGLCHPTKPYNTHIPQLDDTFQDTSQGEKSDMHATHINVQVEIMHYVHALVTVSQS